MQAARFSQLPHRPLYLAESSCCCPRRTDGCFGEGPSRPGSRAGGEPPISTSCSSQLMTARCEFLRYAQPAALAERGLRSGTVLVAEEGERLVGMLELRDLDHIAMLFVETPGQGIGGRLLEGSLEICRESKPCVEKVTVHASRYAVPIYRRFGRCRC